MCLVVDLSGRFWSFSSMVVLQTFVIFGAVGIWNLVRGIMKNVETSLEANTNQETVLVASIENQTK